MPVSKTTQQTWGLRLQHARVLAHLVPDDLTDPPFLWPHVARAHLGLLAGFTSISGTLTRVLNGIRSSNRTSGAPHLGLIGLGYVEEVVLDVMGKKEVSYCATAAGAAAYARWLGDGGRLPPIKPAVKATNTKRGYKRGENQQNRPVRKISVDGLDLI